MLVYHCNGFSEEHGLLQGTERRIRFSLASGDKESVSFPPIDIMLLMCEVILFSHRVQFVCFLLQLNNVPLQFDSAFCWIPRWFEAGGDDISTLIFNII